MNRQGLQQAKGTPFLSWSKPMDFSRFCRPCHICLGTLMELAKLDAKTTTPWQPTDTPARQRNRAKTSFLLDRTPSHLHNEFNMLIHRTRCPWCRISVRGRHPRVLCRAVGQLRRFRCGNLDFRLTQLETLDGVHACGSEVNGQDDNGLVFPALW